MPIVMWASSRQAARPVALELLLVEREVRKGSLNSEDDAAGTSAVRITSDARCVRAGDVAATCGSMVRVMGAHSATPW